MSHGMSRPVAFVIDDGVIGAHGAERLEGLTVRDRASGRCERVQADALFVLIGGEPRTQWLPDTIQREQGYILTGQDVVREGAVSVAVAAGPGTAAARDPGPRCLRRRGRPLPVDQAGRLGRRGRRHRDSPDARVPHHRRP